MISHLLDFWRRWFGTKKPSGKSRREAAQRSLRVEAMEERVLLASDFGDAPDPIYATLATSNGPSHVVLASGPILGNRVDTEADGLASAGANGDDVVGVDDEDGVTFSEMTPGQAATMTVSVSNANGRVDAWIDFDQDGVFETKVINNQFITAGTSPTFNFTVPSTAIAGPTFARIRVSSLGNLLPTGAAADGEVEDYRVVILGADYGDAPAPPYATLASASGPSHQLTANGPVLGFLVDGDVDGQPNASATGDDVDGIDDEDGVTLSDMFRGQSATVDVTVSNASGRIDAWIDFDQNGIFAPSEQILSNQLVSANTSQNFPFPVPLTAVLGPTFARFRVSTNGVGTPTGAAADGEVEDYQVSIVEQLDYGDAPDSGAGTGFQNYQTTLADNGARHAVGGPRLGASVDVETDALQSPLANGDDNDVTDDENGVTFSDLFPATILPTMGVGYPATITVGVTGAGGFVDAWIDFDRDGFFESKIVDTQFIAANGTTSYNFVVPSSSVAGVTFARVRVSSTGNLGPTGAAPDGEVEDYQVELVDIDFGDAPDTGIGTSKGNYRTTLIDFGPQHPIRGPRLGASVDREPNGQPSTNAAGDDNNGADDENGVSFSAFEAGSAAFVTVNVQSAGGFVSGWVDWNQDGDFVDPGEQIIANSSFLAGETKSFNFTVPANALAGTTYMRYRVSTDFGLFTTGLASDGEVEDYTVSIDPFGTVDFGDALDAPFPTGGPDDVATLLANNGPRHTLSAAGPRLGSFVDGEADGQPSANGLGDDNLDAPDDEDGVTFGALSIGTDGSMTVNVQNAGGFVDAWIDFDNDGIFEHKVVDNQFMAADTTRTFVFNVEPTGSAGNAQRWARIRVSSGGNLAPTGLAGDGEVEDYLVTIGPQPALDFGDAPDTGFGGVVGPDNYNTLLIDNGPRHTPAIFGLGLLASPGTDADNDGQQSPDGLGDDNVTTDDEGVITVSNLFVGQSATLSYTVHDRGAAPPAAVTYFVDAWIDFDQDGVFETKIIDTLGVTVGTRPGEANFGANFSVPNDALTGETFLRIRVSQFGNLQPTGFGGAGEVEDHVVTVASLDFGDAPDPTSGNGINDYNTTLASNGPRHIITPTGPRLGLNVDLDLVGQASGDALGDDNETIATDPAPGDDEDGVIFGGLTVGQNGSATVTVTNANGLVSLWVDFNQDGDFLDILGGINERVVTNSLIPRDTTSTLSFVLPNEALIGPTFARVRVSTAGTASPVGLVNDGEVEDYRVNITGFDFGDAPDATPANGINDYSTTQANNGPSHFIFGPRLGLLVDAEGNGFQSLGAQGDDNFLTDDEDGAAFSTALIGQNATATITVTNPDNGQPGLVDAWIDFNQNGVFETSAGEKIISSQSVAAGSTVPFTYLVPAIAVPGITYARVRVSSTGNLTPLESTGDGEVEDHQVLISALDFGDLPDSSISASTLFPTRLVDNGPRHIITTTGPRLGTVVDHEVDGVPTLTADGDDLNKVIDDEDGVVFGDLFAGQTGSVSVTVTNLDGRVDAWLDFNGNGVFDATEKIVNNLLVTNGFTQTFTFPVPSNAALGERYARVRVNSSAILTPNGLANDGEVEDYIVEIREVDFGDAPTAVQTLFANSYPTTLADDGARHVIDGISPFLGLNAPDDEPDGQPTATANGDDINGVDDEDGASFTSVETPNKLTAASLGSALIDVNGFDGFVHMWVDFNQDGVFAATEKVADDVPVLAAAGATQLDFNVAQSAETGFTYARVRVVGTSTPGMAPIGLIEGGEVEDYRVEVVGTDFGDAPASYGTGQHNAGGPRFGTIVDSETTAHTSSNALGDDTLDGVDDEEDAAVFSNLLIGQTGVLTATVNNPRSPGSNSYVSAWIDYDKNGVFDADERVANAVLVLADGLPHALPGFIVSSNLADPTVIQLGDTFARVRVRTSNVSFTSANQVAVDGEAEDYLVTIRGQDFGDAPDVAPGTAGPGSGAVSFDYETRLSSNGPRHVVTASSPRLGIVDIEGNGQPTATANGDDVNDTDPPNTGADDEDGAVFNGGNGNILAAGQTDATITVTASVGSGLGTGFLQAWVDFNRDGDFLDAGEQVVNTSLALTQTPTPQTLTFTVPSASLEGTSFARVRISSTNPALDAWATVGGTSASGVLLDGEVEDHRVEIRVLDFGDAPASYGTAFASSPNPARHLISTTDPFLGAFRDFESDGQPSATAIGDDTLGSPDDEDGVTVLDSTGAATVLLTAGLGASLRVNVTDPTTTAAGTVDARLYAWIDLDGDGAFNDTTDLLNGGEKVYDGVNLDLTGINFQTFNLPTFVLPETVTRGNTIVRVRLVEPNDPALALGSLLPTGSANSGEVEDYFVTIQGFDFGDAPDGIYATLVGSNGARHVIGGPVLGTEIDAEADGLQDLNALGDDLDFSDDEDGVTFGTFFVAQLSSASVTVNGVAGRVDGWIDFNQDGIFDNSAASVERIITSQSVAAGATGVFTVNVPATAATGPTFARIRVSTNGSLPPVGPAADGEVEDYQVIIGSLDFGDAPDNGVLIDGLIANYGTTITNDGARHGANGPTIGTTRDSEVNAATPLDSTGDDATGIDDENGVSVTTLTAGLPSTFTINAQNVVGAAVVQAWFDFDRDGRFDHPTEQIVNRTVTVNGPFTVPFTPPAGSLGVTYVRFRISTTGGLTPTGQATDGEVEDYRVEVFSPGFGGPILNFEGQGNTGSDPPQPVGDVGTNHYVQAVNGPSGAQVRIFGKTGNTISTFDMDTLGGGAGGGDPFVLYDHLADRWLLTEIAAAGNSFIVHLSNNGTPSNNPADWFTFAVATPNRPDHVVLGMWDNGYYATVNEVDALGDHVASSMYAIDRANLILGIPRRAEQRFTQPDLAGFNFQALTPVDLDGVAPPLNSPAYFMRHNDDEVHSAAQNTADFLEVYQLFVNFNNPALSNISLHSNIPVDEFSSHLCGLNATSCFPQPGGVDPPLNPVQQIIMSSVRYRNFGTYESIVGAFTTDFSGQDDGGVRWFEIRKTVGNPWALSQEGEVSILNDNRFIPSIAQDVNKNIALGYSVVDTDVAASIRYIGRRAADPLGTMTTFENTLVAGLGSVPSNLWGDLSAMTIDPSDGRTFWYTNAYADGNDWSTRIGAFAFNGQPGVIVQEDVTVSESGDATPQTYAVALTATPTAPVQVTATADGQTEISLDGSNFFNSVVFSLSSTAAQLITVRAIDDGIFEFGDHISVITNRITQSTDPRFPIASLLNATIIVQDNDILTSPLVGVDFGPDGLTPINWTRIGGQPTPSIINDLINENGTVTAIDLSLIDSGGPFTDQAVTVNAASLPTHVQTLAGLDGNASFGPTDTITATWGDLVPGGEYQIWVFGLDATLIGLSQDVTIVGGTTLTFTQTFSQNGLAINDEIGSSARTLDSYAEVMTASPSGQIRITVVADPLGSADVALAGLAIRPILPQLDFGDAPTAAQSGFASSYPTLVADNGASHLFVQGGPILGDAIDSEPDGQPNATATGDDGSNTDDEDAVTFTSALTPGSTATVNVLVTGTGLLDAWIDYNQDGDWNDLNEQVLFSAPVTNTVGRLFATSLDDGVGNEIIEINPATGAIIRTLQAPQTVGIISGLAFDGTSLWYVEGIGGSQDRLYQIDPDTGLVLNVDPLDGLPGVNLQTVLGPPPGAPVNLTFDGLAALNGKIYIQEQENDRIHVFDPITNTFQPIPLTPGVQLRGGLDAITNPDALIAADSSTKTIYTIDPITGVVTGSFTHNLIENSGVAVLGNEIYLADLDRDITVTNRLGAVLRTIAVQPSVASTNPSIRSAGGGTGAVSGSQVNSLTFNVPATAVFGATYARFRLSSAGNLTPAGPAADGEVEDLAIVIGGMDNIGVSRNALFFEDANDNGDWDGTAGGDFFGSYGAVSDRPLAGDWNGDGFDQIAVYRPGTSGFYRDSNGNGLYEATDALVFYGTSGDLPIIGDWNADGIDDIGVYRPSTRSFIKDSNGSGAYNISDEVVIFGAAGDLPIIGDWNGDGEDDIGVYRPSTGQFIKDSNGDGVLNGGDQTVLYGANGDVPLVGDWNGNGIDDIGVHRPSTAAFYLDSNGNGAFDGSDRQEFFGALNDKPLIGNWRPPTPLTAAGGAAVDSTGANSVVSADLTTIVSAAVDLLGDAGLDAAQVQMLNQVTVQIADLSGALLGQAIGMSITIDVNAAGHGWFVDSTPYDNEEFPCTSVQGLSAAGESAAAGQMDLLSVVLHELGHILGLDDDHSDIDSNHVMNGSLAQGIRRLPTAGELAELLFK